MFFPLVDSLRCPNPHAETWLVASIERAEERDIKEGTLGCPSCLAEYAVRDGIVYFVEGRPPAPATSPSEDEAMRLAATLDLTDQRMIAVLQGTRGAHAQLVAAFSPAQLLLLNPPGGVASGDGISIVVSDLAPLAAGAVNAVAIDGAISGGMLASLRRAMRGGARLFAPSAMPLPPGVTELARDADVWVARLDDAATVSAPVPLTLRPRTDRR
jgi:uncharacterized protein YbaR (Trm112 family)